MKRQKIENVNTARGTAQDEEQFYNSVYDKQSIKISRFSRWLAGMSPAMPYTGDILISSLDDVEGKNILEIGCGTGDVAARLASLGAVVAAIEISSAAVEQAIHKHASLIPEKLSFQQMDACKLKFEDSSFDIVIGDGVLHHLDTDRASGEIQRVLKPGGKAVFVEPLAHNLISNLWRRMTPAIHSTEERPLTYLEIQTMGDKFSSCNYREFNFLPLFSSFVYLVTHSQNAKLSSGRVLSRMDAGFLKICKPFRRYSAQILLDMTR